LKGSNIAISAFYISLVCAEMEKSNLLIENDGWDFKDANVDLSWKI
jgi:hypothetical protein